MRSWRRSAGSRSRMPRRYLGKIPVSRLMTHPMMLSASAPLRGQMVHQVRYTMFPVRPCARIPANWFCTIGLLPEGLGIRGTVRTPGPRRQCGPRFSICEQTRPVPRAGLEPATHGSSGHVSSDPRIRAATRMRRHMVTSDSKWFNEMDGEQALSSIAVRAARFRALTGG